jgi:hypothetical protein
MPTKNLPVVTVGGIEVEVIGDPVHLTMEGMRVLTPHFAFKEIRTGEMFTTTEVDTINLANAKMMGVISIDVEALRKNNAELKEAINKAKEAVHRWRVVFERLKDDAHMSNEVYAAIIGECEKMEHMGAFKGNGHHLAQKLTLMIVQRLSTTEL